MIATMDDIKYKEHKLAEKAQRIEELRKELHNCRAQKSELMKNKPTCDKNKLSYEESLEFGEKIDRFEEELQAVELNELKIERQLSALELQTQKLLPVSGIKIKVSKYSEDGQPLQTYCISQVESKEQKEQSYDIEIEEHEN